MADWRGKSFYDFQSPPSGESKILNWDSPSQAFRTRYTNRPSESESDDDKNKQKFWDGDGSDGTRRAGEAANARRRDDDEMKKDESRMKLSKRIQFWCFGIEWISTIRRTYARAHPHKRISTAGNRQFFLFGLARSCRTRLRAINQNLFR